MTNDAPVIELSQHDNVFGTVIEYPRLPEHDMVIVCVNRHYHQPVTMLLPHQVYVHYMKKILEEYPDASGVTLIPYRNDDKVVISKADVERWNG